MTKKTLLGPRVGPEILMPMALACTLFGEFTPISCSLPILITFILLLGAFGCLAFHFQKYRWTTVFGLGALYGIGILANQPLDSTKTFENTYTILRLSDVQKTERGIHATGQIYSYQNHGRICRREKANCYLSTKVNQIKNGDVIATTSPSRLIKNSGNPGSFEMETFYKSKGIRTNFFINDSIVILGNYARFSDQMKNFQHFLGTRMGKYVEGKELALANALILGDVSEIENQARDDFSATGAIHVLAVSGMHITLFAQILCFGFQFCARWTSRRNATLIILVILWLYALLTGFSPSVIRSVFMFTLFQFGTFCGLKAHSNSILFFSAWILLLVSPNYIYDIGFQLSYLAVFGILNYHQKIKAIWQPKNRLLGYFWEATAVSIAAQLFTVPLTLYHFHYFPNYFLLANLGITLISSISMYIGFAYLFLQEIPIIQEILGVSFKWTLKIMTEFIHFVANLSGSVEAGFDLSIWMVLAMFLSVLWFFHARTRFISLRIFPVIAVIIGITFGRYSHNNTAHLLLLNAKHPLFILNHQGHGTVFYSSYEKNINNVSRIKGEYEKIYPIQQWQTKEIKERQTYYAPKNALRIQSIRNGYKVSYLNKKYLVIRVRKFGSKTRWKLIEKNRHRTTLLSKALAL